MCVCKYMLTAGLIMVGVTAILGGTVSIGLCVRRAYRAIAAMNWTLAPRRAAALAGLLLLVIGGLTMFTPAAQGQPYRRDWRRDDYDWRRNDAWRRQREWRRDECYRHPWRCR